MLIFPADIWLGYTGVMGSHPISGMAGLPTPVKPLFHVFSPFGLPFCNKLNKKKERKK